MSVVLQAFQILWIAHSDLPAISPSTVLVTISPPAKPARYKAGSVIQAFSLASMASMALNYQGCLEDYCRQRERVKAISG